MGKLNMFVIVFDNAQGVYYAGQMVQGYVTIELNAEMKMRGIRIGFDGKAYVHWAEQHTVGAGKNRHTVTRNYSATETYFNQEVLICGRWPSQNGEDFVLPPGRHSYPFAFQLPPSLPSSFEGSVGYVRYYVKGVIDKPWKFDHTTKRPFTIICLLNLNQEPTASLPMQEQNMKTLCCLCCASGPISALLRLDRRGYVPGEAIGINAEVDNKSNRKMDSSFAVLKMVTIFHATGKTKTVTREVAKVCHGPILEGDSDIWMGGRDVLVLPPLPPSYLIGCKIIDIKYILEFHVDPSGPGFDLVVPLEIILGTIPLQYIVQQNPPIAHPTIGLPGPPMFAPAGDGLQPYAAPTSDALNMPPPSYSECVFGKVDVKDEDDSEYTSGDMNYAPVYTYYDWGHTPSAPPL